MIYDADVDAWRDDAPDLTPEAVSAWAAIRGLQMVGGNFFAEERVANGRSN